LTDKKYIEKEIHEVGMNKIFEIAGDIIGHLKQAGLKRFHREFAREILRKAGKE
jgi:hypothetical protein